MKVNGKVIVVTGGGNGIGRELVLQLLNQGSRIAAIDVSMSALEETYDLSGRNPKLSLHRVDITDKHKVRELVNDVVAIHHHVDGVINNAGIIQPFVKVADINEGLAERIINVNYFGTFYMIKAFLPRLLERPEAHILNVASMGGFFPVPGQSIYGASKAAVKLMTEGLAVELKETNVSVSVVIPGGTATDIMKNSELSSTDSKVTSAQMKILLTPKKAASIIIRTMEGNKVVAYIGKDSKAMNLLYKISPKIPGKLMGIFVKDLVKQGEVRES